MPLALTGATLQAWMKSEKVDLSVIGLFSLVGMPYALKFLWAPLMDRFIPPFLGRRRGWILIAQIFLILSISAMAFVHPSAAPAVTAGLAFLICFFSASQDIVIDAYRTDLLPSEELGLGASFHVTGYRIAMLVSGSLALILADHLSWPQVYFTMAAAMSIGVIASLIAPELEQTSPPKSLREAVVLPLVEFFQRTGAFEVLAFLLFYKIDVVMAVALTTPFMLDLGFSNTDIGAVTKSVGLVATIVGSLAGGALMVPLGLYRSLWIFGLVQGISTAAFICLAHVGHVYSAMVTAIAAENFCSGLGNTAYFAFMMSMCNKRFTATQFALFSSFMAFTRVVGGAPTGFLVKALGWQNFYVVCIFAMIPGLLLLFRYPGWKKVSDETT